MAWSIGPTIGGKNYSEGMPDEPTELGVGALWYFDFPKRGGSVHYVTRGRRVPIKATRLRARFEIKAIGRFVSKDGGDTPAVRLHIQRAGDDWSGTGQYANYRLWSRPLALAPGKHVLEALLQQPLWTNVQGQTSGLKDTLSEPKNIGVTFGSVELSAGHGVYVVGSARFTMLGFAFL